MISNKIKASVLFGVTMLFSPSVVLAFHGGPDSRPVLDILGVFLDAIGAALPVIVGLAVLLFLWGLLKYILNADDPAQRASSRSLMVWGVVIIFVMVSVWGLVNFLDDIFGLSSGAVPNAPGIPGTNSGCLFFCF